MTITHFKNTSQNKSTYQTTEETNQNVFEKLEHSILHILKVELKTHCLVLRH